MPDKYVRAMIVSYSEQFLKTGYLDSTALRTSVETLLTDESEEVSEVEVCRITKMKNESVSQSIPRSLKALQSILIKEELVLVGKVLLSRSVVDAFRNKFKACMLTSHWFDLVPSLNPNLTESSGLVQSDEAQLLIADLITVANTITTHTQPNENAVDVVLVEVGWPSSVISVGGCVLSKGYTRQALKQAMHSIVKAGEGQEVASLQCSEDDEYCIIGGSGPAASTSTTSTLKLTAKQKRNAKKGKQTSTSERGGEVVDSQHNALIVETLLSLSDNSDLTREFAQQITEEVFSPIVSQCYRKVCDMKLYNSSLFVIGSDRKSLSEHQSNIEACLVSCFSHFNLYVKNLNIVVGEEEGRPSVLNTHYMHTYGRYCLELLMRWQCVKTLGCDIENTSPLTFDVGLIPPGYILICLCVIQLGTHITHYCLSHLTCCHVIKVL